MDCGPWDKLVIQILPLRSYVPFNLDRPLCHTIPECCPKSRVAKVGLSMDNDIIRVRVVLVVKFGGRHTGEVGYVKINLVHNLFNS